MRELLKQYLTVKQNGCLRSGCLQEVVTMRELTVPQINSNHPEVITEGFQLISP